MNMSERVRKALEKVSTSSTDPSVHYSKKVQDAMARRGSQSVTVTDSGALHVTEEEDR